MNTFTIVVLRIVHVVSGAFWLGVAVFNAFFLLPAVRATGPAAGQLMVQLVRVRKLPQYVNVAILLTVISGLILFGWRAGGLGSWMTSPSGMAFGAGAVLALVTAVIGMAIITPTAARLGRLSESAATATESEAATIRTTIQQLQTRMQSMARIAAWLLILAAACMASGRYV